jgi:predicted AlkP superfamily pyrophosphatase or phosphodiesterase
MLIRTLLLFCLLFESTITQACYRAENTHNSNEQNRVSTLKNNQTEQPQLILLIIVDQFRYDYLERFGKLFVTNGLKRLQREGASWTNANFDHMPTYTAPGHATLMTGTWPAANGIIANGWFDRASGKDIESISDEKVKALGSVPDEGASPRNLVASTIGDELRIRSNNRSKVIGTCLKDRGAILPTGRLASAAYWFSDKSGEMISSTYYLKELPSWVKQFNASRPADKFFKAEWSRLLPQAEYERYSTEDSSQWEQPGANNDKVTFPHIITGGSSSINEAFYKALYESPFSNELLLNFTKQAIEHEKLGMDQDTDLLSISFSANDLVGHNYGPYSQEVMDVTLRVDRLIEDLLNYVDQKVGLEKSIVIFTADHGMAPYPEHAAHIGLSGGRVNVDEILDSVRKEIAERILAKSGKQTSTDYIQSFKNENIYFDLGALKRDGIDRREVERIAGEAALKVPGVVRYFTRTQLETGSFLDSDLIARRVQHGFYPTRSGDVILVYEPFKISSSRYKTANHGSPYSYDTHVPLMIMGNGIKAGEYKEAVTPADIAPTLSMLLRLQVPSNSTGRVLIEALKTDKVESR